MSRAKISTFLKRMTSGVILTAIVATSYIQPVFATESLIDLIQKGHLSNYIPGDVCTGQNSPVGSVLTDSELPTDIGASIEKFKPMYEAAAKEAGIPWQMLAGVHYRENTFAEDADLQAGNPFKGDKPRYSSSYAKYGYPNNLQDSMNIAAKVIQDDAQSKNLPIYRKKIDVANINIEQIKDTLYSYNGRAGVYAQEAAKLGFDPATQPYEGSPYVMSRYDAKHTDMKIITEDFGPANGIDKRFGAFTIYFLIGGPADGDSAAVGRGDCGGAGGGVGGTFDEIIKSYAWPDYHPPLFVTMKDGYREAVAAAKLNREYIGGTIYEAIDCGGFVTRVMRNSGTDKNYNAYNGNTIYQKRYMDDHPELYLKVPDVNDNTGTKNLRKGDIAMNATHTYIYVDKIEGFNGNSASASWDERAPMASPAYGFSDFTWYRYKQPSTGGSSKPL
ncbi:MAG TPA: hypothetical protein VFO38_01140 [Candidatus Saccharimonadales bacterium]|nr:hypothetical protein [Candidatus Saccharimonadales bacterium]